ncbi:MAG: hypothetical protein Q4A83_06865 [Bacillota bacterium]|nr:hypothetical protein [Bacillota bacterium]
MEYPIFIDGAERGRLRVTREGIRTRFFAECEKAQGIIRLWVFGKEKRAYLGVLCPEADKLILSKCFSRNEMRCFPSEIEYASNEEIKKENSIEERNKKWVMSTKGCLILNDGNQKYIAIPADGKRLEKTGLVKRIDGRDYLVFRK